MVGLGTTAIYFPSLRTGRAPRQPKAEVQYHLSIPAHGDEPVSELQCYSCQLPTPANGEESGSCKLTDRSLFPSPSTGRTRWTWARYPNFLFSTPAHGDDTFLEGLDKQVRTLHPCAQRGHGCSRFCRPPASFPSLLTGGTRQAQGHFYYLILSIPAHRDKDNRSRAFWQSPFHPCAQGGHSNLFLKINLAPQAARRSQITGSLIWTRRTLSQ